MLAQFCEFGDQSSDHAAHEADEEATEEDDQEVEQRAAARRQMGAERHAAARGPRRARGRSVCATARAVRVHVADARAVLLDTPIPRIYTDASFHPYVYGKYYKCIINEY